MIIKTQADVTTAVLADIARADNPRFREVMTSLVRHLHDFAREVKLTEAEFQLACAYVNALGKKTTDSHNEAVLMAGSLGLSSLVCLLNNGDGGSTETTANLLGPFWRLDSPRTANDASIVRSPTPGTPLFVDIAILDRAGQPVTDAEVDVWHCSEEGYYENHDPDQADMNLRGKFTSDATGHVRFRTIKPIGYPIPVDGPVGDVLRAQKRHNLRPAHLHFLIFKPGFKTQVSQVYASDDPNLDTDVQFGVTRRLIGEFVRHDDASPPAADISGPWISLDYTFVIEPGEARLPRPPITDKLKGDRPRIERLVRS